MSTPEELRCHRCSDVIGVYEPMVVLRNGIPVRTSRAAAAIERAPGELCFHVDCFTSLHADENLAAGRAQV
jgi:hypothetical protein